ncbi:hypothetical protein NSTC731_00578 [Nostoc sp. DSM 114167]
MYDYIPNKREIIVCINYFLRRTMEYTLILAESPELNHQLSSANIKRAKLEEFR